MAQCYKGSGHPNIIAKLLGTSAEGITETLYEGITSFINSQMDIINEHLSYQEDENSQINVNMMATWNEKIK